MSKLKIVGVVVLLIANLAVFFLIGRATAPAVEAPAEPAAESVAADSSAATPAPDTTTPVVVNPVVPVVPAPEDEVRLGAYLAEAAAAEAVTARKAVTDLSQRVTALEEKPAATPAPTPSPANPVVPAAPAETPEEARIRRNWLSFPNASAAIYAAMRRDGRRFNFRADDPKPLRDWIAQEEGDFQAWLKGTKP